MIVFDCETKPRPDLVRRFIKPYPTFNPDEVKYGNTKDPVKRAELLALKEAEHKAGEAAYWQNAEERASLNPLTAEVLCVGLLIDGEPVIIGQNSPVAQDEADVLRAFWRVWSDRSNGGEKFVFWSGNGNPAENFDLDMLVRRSWIVGVPVPPLVFNGRHFSSRFEDVAGRYLLYKREAFCGLSRAADELGLFRAGCDFTPKGEDDLVTGANFHLWWEGKAGDVVAAVEQRQLAVKYLTNDLRLLEAIAGRLGYADVELATA
jgi:hypothetical protein